MVTEQGDTTQTMQTQNAEGALCSWHYDGYSIHQVGADLGGEAFLLQTEDGATALFDTGFAYCAPQTLENIYAVTGGSPAEKIVLTHSHYDHCAATGYLLEHMPHAQVLSSAYAAHVFTRPGAYATMNQLNDARAEEKGFTDYPQVSEIATDTVLQDGDTFRVGNLEFQAMQATGHTKCCMAFWCAGAGLFFSTETSGVVCPAMTNAIAVPEDVHYMVDLIELVSYTSAMEHIARVRQLPISVFVATHYGCIAGDNIADMWHALDFWNGAILKLVLGMHEQGASAEEIIAVYKDTFYWGGTAPYQPEAAFDLNATYAIPTIIRDNIDAQG